MVDPKRLLNRAGRAALAGTAVLGSACLLLTLAAVVLGVHPLVFRSGSMSPGIPTGSLGFARSADAGALRVGDVVTVRTAGGSRVTHRVVAITHHVDQATLELKGDANKAPDTELYPVRKVDRLWFSVPVAGYVVAWFSHAPGSYLLAAYVALMLLLLFRRPQADAGSAGPAGSEAAPRPGDKVVAEEDAPGTDPERRRRKPLLAAGIAGVLVVGLVTLAGWGSATWAAWTDTATVSGTALTSGNWSAPGTPVITACTRNTSSGQITVTWSAASNATSYNLKLSNPNSTINGVTSPATTTTIVKNNSGTVQVVAVNAFGSTTSVAWTYDGSGSNQACHS